MKLLVTGANGFIGRALCTEAMSRGLAVRGITRVLGDLPDGVDNIAVGSIDENTIWQNMFMDCEVVVHLAARVHVMKEAAVDPLEEFRRVNVRGTLNFARQAAAEGVRRFVFLSSVGVNGVETLQQPFSPGDSIAPHLPYAVSKYEAELGLRAFAFETGMEIVIIRPPLVYGPNAPGNFGALMRWLRRGFPLPLGAVTKNRRSLVALDNLVDLILTCVHHQKAANQTFFVSDGEDLSTTELLQRMEKAMNRSVHLLPVPVSLLRFAATLFDKRPIARSLLSSLQVDISKTCQVLNWSPPVSVDEGLHRAVRGGG